MAKKKKNGEGTVRYRKDGRWEGIIIVSYNAEGKPQRKSVLAHTEKECRAKLEELKKTHGLTGSTVRTKAKPDMTLSAWLTIWYENYKKPRLRYRTQEEYENVIYNHVIPNIGKIKLNALTYNDVQTFLTQLKLHGRCRFVDKFGSGVSDMLVRQNYMILHAALQRAVDDKLIRHNVATGSKIPPKKAREMKPLTHVEIRNFLIQAREEGVYPIAMLELSTGLRRGELCGLQWDDLNLDSGALRVTRQIYRTKNGLEILPLKTKQSERTIYLPQPVLEELKEYKQSAESRWIFPSSQKPDSPRDPTGLSKRISNVMKHAGIENVRFHDLRHTFATVSLEYGMDIKTLSMIIGHNSAATTLDIYSHVTDTMQKTAAEKIEGKIGNGDAYEKREAKLPAPKQKERITPYEPYKGKCRRAGTGGIYEINDHLFEGRYTPTNAHGKREAHNVYAKTYEECEQKLNAMIEEVKARIKTDKERLKQQAL